jgi:hypothetical protein
MSREEYLELKLISFLVVQELACEIILSPNPILIFEDSIVRPN